MAEDLGRHSERVTGDLTHCTWEAVPVGSFCSGDRGAEGVFGFVL